jgi:hypothetical protein
MTLISRFEEEIKRQDEFIAFADKEGYFICRRGEIVYYKNPPATLTAWQCRAIADELDKRNVI